MSNLMILVLCVALCTACSKSSEPEAILATPSSLVTVKLPEVEHEHKEHDDDKSAHREVGAHVHGAASMSVVLENTQLNITMSIPGMDAVGFEHPATSADEQAALNQTLRYLQNPDALFPLPKSAECQLVNGVVETALLDKTASVGAHADMDIDYQWTCKHPEYLKQLSVQLFSFILHLQKIQASWISQNKQGAAELTKENTELSFE